MWERLWSRKEKRGIRNKRVADSLLCSGMLASSFVGGTARDSESGDRLIGQSQPGQPGLHSARPESQLCVRHLGDINDKTWALS